MTRLVTILLLAGMAFGQETTAPKAPGTPVSDATRRWLQREATNLIAAAERMPAEKYGFQPTPQQMTFAHLMTHIVESNRYMCSGIAGEPLPKASGVTDSDGKDKLVADVKASFEYCRGLLAKLDDSRLSEEVPAFKHTRADVMIFLIADHADHYATAAIYLRLNGLLPPTAKPSS
ncbi:MAG: DinB family protein [Acidobacteria bacterium]|nr:DinB family protein [Acidobacteriota bacterium]